MNALLILTAILGAPQEEMKFPLSSGRAWTYRSGDRQIEWKLGDLEEFHLEGGRQAKGWKLLGYADDASYLVETEHGVRIFTTRRVGVAAVPTLVIVADLRWRGAEEWQFETMDGCMRSSVRCRRKGLEIIVGDETYRLASGIGIEKFTSGKDTWELEYFPVKTGGSWKYRVRGARERVVTWKVGEAKEIQILGVGKSKGWRLEGFAIEESYLVPFEGGVRFVSQEQVGEGGDPALVIEAELRWTGKDAWEFRTMHGCFAEDVKCSRISEKVGEYDCVKIAVARDQYFWVARGVGIVKRQLGNLPGTETWELAR